MWLFKFIKNIKNNEKITYDICQMAIKSIKLYDSMAKKEKLKFDKLNKGIIHLYMDKNILKKQNLLIKYTEKLDLIVLELLIKNFMIWNLH